MTTYAIAKNKGTGWRNVRTGILFVIGILMVASLALIIGKNTTMLTSHSVAHIILPDIKGLNTGNLVSIAGKKVGTVSALEFTRIGDSTKVLVDLKIREEYYSLLTVDSKAMIKSLGMLGDKYVDITLGASQTHLKDGDYLAVVQDVGLEDLAGQAGKALESVGRASESLVKIMGRVERGEGSLGQLLTTTEASDRLNSALAHIESVAAMYDDPAVGKNFASSINNMNMMSGDFARLSSSLEQGNGTFGKLLKSDSLYNQLTFAARSADSMMTSITRRANAVLDGYQPGSQFYLGLNKSVASLDSLLLDMKRNPQRYLKISVF